MHIGDEKLEFYTVSIRQGYLKRWKNRKAHHMVFKHNRAAETETRGKLEGLSMLFDPVTSKFDEIRCKDKWCNI